MKMFYKLLIGLLLLFNGIGAIYGGINLMIYPDGSSIQLSPDWIEGTMFNNYFIPGLVLFIANGLFSIFTLITLAFNLKNHNWFVIFQGAILTGWILIQILLIQTIYFLHIVLGGVGIVLIVLGFALKRQEAGSVNPGG
ncbi:MAG: hypothetical protein IPI31_01830 [Bacteroidetes bacterium]|jgi:hypothetical protein|nr:hypothetical protein [Bacteroidota bacterium]